MTEHDESAPMIPGLEPPAPRESALERAARRTIAAIAEEQLLTERHAVICQLILDLAASIDAGRRSGKASAVAMAAAQLQSAYELLPIPEGGDSDGAWDELVAELRRSGPAVRDQA